ncbi:hypothetical protein APU01nite_20750 [Alkalibacterium putridalgicola]|uniref:Uncharacterized protein n=1 Tax=Alkalibacterium putridalgicola TaxID=426703 RepID=A0ABQ0UZR4_9LACT|nr:hypothetical protein APU01nite_20750 [Alkalibacterium putridalgicola]
MAGQIEKMPASLFEKQAFYYLYSIFNATLSAVHTRRIYADSYF